MRSDDEDGDEDKVIARRREVTRLGSMLFSLCVSGARIVVPGMYKKVQSFEFADYGGHCSGGYHSAYITVTSSIGMTLHDMHEFVFRLLQCYHQLLKLVKQREHHAQAHA